VRARWGEEMRACARAHAHRRLHGGVTAAARRVAPGCRPCAETCDNMRLRVDRCAEAPVGPCNHAARAACR
jgi:hypothetical protein